MKSKAKTSQAGVVFSLSGGHRFYLYLAALSMLLACHTLMSYHFLISRHDEKYNRKIDVPQPKEIESENFVRFAQISKEQEKDNVPSDSPPAERTWLLPTMDHPATTGKIPQIVNKIYFQKDGQFQDMSKAKGSESLIAAHQSWPKMNPGYNIRYFNLRLAREYLRKYFHPIFIRTFDCIQAFAGKSNFFRMVLLYRDGGWHSDWKEDCLIPNLLDTISNGTDFFASHDTAVDWGRSEGCSQNAFVGVRPRHPAIAKTIEKIMRNVQNMYYGYSAAHTTGVCVLGSAIHEAGYEFAEGFKFVYDHKTGTNHFYWKDELIVNHKCDGCGSTQNWGSTGNDYVEMWQKKNYYCEDASSLFDEVTDDEAME